MRRFSFLFLTLLAFVLGDPGAGACTTAIVSADASASGRPLLWKQRDTDNPYNVLVHVRGGKYAYTAVFSASDKQRKRAFGGANEAGFAIMNNASYNLAEQEYEEWANSKVMNEALQKMADAGGLRAPAGGLAASPGHRSQFRCGRRPGRCRLL